MNRRFEDGIPNFMKTSTHFKVVHGMVDGWNVKLKFSTSMSGLCLTYLD